jgi:hypothetical protein
MASLATNWVGSRLRQNQPAQNQTPKALVKSTRQGHYALRALPNEDIALWVKSIDNSRVERQAEAGAHSDLWRFIGGAVAAVALVVGLLLPGAYSWLAGYQLSALERQQKELLDQRELLKLEQARAESPKQLEVWAEQHGMKAPDSRRVVYLRPAGDRSVAMKVAADSAAGNR